MITRMFGVVAVLVGLSYLAQGVRWLMFVVRDGLASDLFEALYTVTVITLDTFLGAAAVCIGVGLLLCRNWARKAWLGYLVFLVLVHVVMATVQSLAGHNITGVARWAGMIVILTIISWVYFIRFFKKSTLDTSSASLINEAESRS